MKSILRIALGTIGILLVPLIAMQFIDDFQWDVADFIIIGALLFSAGLAYQLVAGRFPRKEQRFAVGFVIVAVVLYVWAELAVGIFTTWGS